MHRNYALLLPLLPVLGLASCAGLGGGADLGRVSPRIIELYDAASPGGEMEFELTRDGRIFEAEAEVDPATLPAKIREAAMQAGPGGEIIGAEHELQRGGLFYEVKVRKDGREWELILDQDGKLRETERSISREEAPSAVITAAQNRIVGGSFESVEIIQRMDAAGEPKETEYHVKFSRDGTSYKVVLDQNGKIHRAVREQAAEIEIPLRQDSPSRDRAGR